MKVKDFEAKILLSEVEGDIGEAFWCAEGRGWVPSGQVDEARRFHSCIEGCKPTLAMDM